ncbi:MAG: acyltransferase [Pseudomonadales bacterium]|nr:acyltransferase [Pseudomonadales bacterium]
MTSILNYRRDIDGLRALAVAPVVFFHSGLDILPGGYVGVDIFFVISGYLISKIIFKELDQETFSLSTFYCRRIRRIFPALFFMIIVSMVVSSFIFTSKDYNELGKSLYSVLLFFSNFHFYDTQDYFGLGADEQVFLHTWSLSVEEQFYIVFPMLLLLLFKYKWTAVRPVLLSFFVMSLVLASITVHENASKAFYFSPFRFWELLTGVLLAIGVFPTVKNRFFLEACAVAGVGLIVGSVLFYDEATVFPGLSALPTCVGTGLIIYAGSFQKTWVTKILGLRALVFLGLISYSLYLWHWPVFVFSKYLYLEQTPLLSWILICLSVCVAWFSWRFVEQPFRHAGDSVQSVYRYSLTGIIALLIVAGVVDATDGLPQRFSDRLQLLMSDENRHPKFRECGGVDVNRNDELTRCFLGVEDQPGTFVLWGDSHAEMIAPAIDNMAVAQGVSGYYFSKSACPPLVFKREMGSERCNRYHQSVLRFIVESPVSDVILSAKWNDSRSLENRDFWLDGFSYVVDELTNSGKRIWFVHQVPEVGVNVPRVMLRNSLLPWKKQPEPTREQVMREQSEYRKWLNNFNGYSNFKELKPEERLCNKTCRFQEQGRSLYKDDNHLSVYGAMFVSGLFRPVFDSENNFQRL